MRPAYHFWANNWTLEHLMMPGENIEGDDFKRYLTDLTFGQDVIDFGCGAGRMADIFSKRRYLGVDINPMAIAAASAAFPRHEFATIDATSPIEGGHLLFALHTLLHVPDNDLQGVIGRFRQRRVIVIEHLVNEVPRGIDDQRALYTRSESQYAAAFDAVGYRLHRVQIRTFSRMSPIAMLEFHRK